MVQKGTEVIIADRGRPVGRILPIQPKNLPIEDRIRRMEDQGLIEKLRAKNRKSIPPPIPLDDGIAHKFLQQDRNNG